MSNDPLLLPPGFDPSVPLPEQAFFWAVYLGSETCSHEDQAAFEDWLASSDAAGTAFREAMLLWRSIGQSEAPGAAAPVPAPSRPAMRQVIRRTPARLGAWLAGAALLAAGVGLALILLPGAGPWPRGAAEAGLAATRYTTPVGVIERIELADGSHVVLGGNSALDVTIGRDIRQAVLVRGQVYFDIRTQAARPFQVTADAARIRVLGTAFDVRLGPADTTVSVVKGRVSVLAGAASSRPLGAGERITVAKGGRLGAVGAFTASQVLGWQEGRFHFEDSRLADLVADLNRYSYRRIELDGAGLEDINISASFDLAQSGEMLASLAAALSLELVEEPDRVVLRRPG